MEDYESKDLAKYAQAYTKLLYVQQNLKVPKNKRAKFGGSRGYNYRSLEDIFNAAKPLLSDAKLILTVSDEIVIIGDVSYVKAKAIVFDVEGTGAISTIAYAQIATDKKGMDVAQMTGSASSYARKYALNGLFAIDDSEDIDSMDHSEKKTTTRAAAKRPLAKKSDSDTISAEQIKEMFKKSKNNKELCLEVIGRYGYESGDEIKQKDYKEICREIEERANDDI